MNGYIALIAIVLLAIGIAGTRIIWEDGLADDLPVADETFTVLYPVEIKMLHGGHAWSVQVLVAQKGGHHVALLGMDRSILVVGTSLEVIQGRLIFTIWEALENGESSPLHVYLRKHLTTSQDTEETR